MESKGSGAWKAIAIALMTFVAGLATGSFASVSRADVEHIVATEAPYLQDKRAIDTKLDDLSAQLSDVNKKLDMVIEEEAARGSK